MNLIDLLQERLKTVAVGSSHQSANIVTPDELSRVLDALIVSYQELKFLHRDKKIPLQIKHKLYYKISQIFELLELPANVTKK